MLTDRDCSDYEVPEDCKHMDDCGRASLAQSDTGNCADLFLADKCLSCDFESLGSDR